MNAVVAFAARRWLVFIDVVVFGFGRGICALSNPFLFHIFFIYLLKKGNKEISLIFLLCNFLV